MMAVYTASNMSLGTRDVNTRQGEICRWRCTCSGWRWPLGGASLSCGRARLSNHTPTAIGSHWSPLWLLRYVVGTKPQQIADHRPMDPLSPSIPPSPSSRPLAATAQQVFMLVHARSIVSLKRAADSVEKWLLEGQRVTCVSNNRHRRHQFNKYLTTSASIQKNMHCNSAHCSTRHHCSGRGAWQGAWPKDVVRLVAPAALLTEEDTAINCHIKVDRSDH